MQSGNATLGSVSPASGNVSALGKQTNSVNASSTNIGQNTIRFSGTGNYSNSAQADAYLTVLDNSKASLENDSDLLEILLDFGQINKNIVSEKTFDIFNRTRADGYRVGLDLDEILKTGSIAFTTNATAFDNLAQGQSETYKVWFDSNELDNGEYTGKITLNLSDDDAFSGSAGNRQLVLNLRGEVIPEPTAAALVLAGFGLSLGRKRKKG